MSTDTHAAIENLLRENRVVLFMKGNRAQPQCGFSAKTVAALDMLLPEYVAVDVLKDPDIRDGIKAYGNWPTVPQLYVDGELIGGSDIVTEMFDAGELGAVLGVTEPTDSVPQIGIATGAVNIMTGAIEGKPGAAIHLKIDANFQHTMSLAPPKETSVAVTSGRVTLHLDKWSAARANGLKISVYENMNGQGFSFDNPNAPPPVKQMTVQELQDLVKDGTLNQPGGPLFFDVRGEDERRIAVLPMAQPWNDDSRQLVEGLAHDTPIIFHCHLGRRSQAVADLYRRKGYTNLYNLTGGIHAWSNDIDPAVPTY